MSVPSLVPRAKPGCPEASRAIVEAHMASMPVAWRIRPRTDETFNSVEAFKERIVGWSFCEGFWPEESGGGTPQVPSMRLKCKHHSAKTRNYRGLEDRVEKDDQGVVISDRKRENTGAGQLLCPYEIRCSYKGFPNRASLVKTWVLTVKNDSHSHELVDDPLVYDKHRQGTREYQAQVSSTRIHRSKVIPYSVSRRILEDDEYGLLITRQEYYNHLRNQPADRDKPKTIEALIVALDDARFVYRTRYDIEVDSEGTAVSRKLVQLFFAHRLQLEATRRFASSFCLVVDGTFNTNVERLPLLVCVGVTNEGQTFPIAFSYCPSESYLSYSFLWESLKEECFTANIPFPKVIIGDWAAALPRSVKDHWPNALLQGCDWHAVEAMDRWFSDRQYTGRAINGYIAEDKTFIPGLHSAAWDYVKSATEDELEENQAYLLSLLQPRDHHYIEDHWGALETRLIHCYTKLLPNLGSTSSQRGECYHPIIKKTLNGKISVEESAKRIMKNVKTILVELERSENLAMTKYPRLLQVDNWAFSLLKCRITFYAAEKIEEEWNAMKHEIEASEDHSINGVLPCQCYILLRFGLPCRHYLQRSLFSGEAIPRSLVHPRYWLRGPIIHPQAWRPFWHEKDIQHPPEVPVVTVPTDVRIAAIRAELRPEEKARFEAQVLREQEKLVEIGQQHLAMQSLPMGVPDALPKPSGRRKRTQGGSRLMTGPENAAFELRARERLAKQALKGKAIEVVRDEDITVIDKGEPAKATTLRPATPPANLSHKRNHSIMVDRTPEKPAPVPTLPAIEDAPTILDFELPPSTAPAATGRPGRAGRISKVNSQQDWRATLIPKKRGGKK
jgi:MULE transposase domain